LLTIGIVEDARVERHAKESTELAKIGVSIIYCTPTELQVLTQRGDVQAVYLQTGIQSVPELGIMAARAGKHVIAPWPVARTLDELRALRVECQTARVQLVPDHSGEHSGLVRVVKDALALGELGIPAALRLVSIEPERDRPASALDDELFVRTARALYLAQQVFGNTPEQVYGQRARASDPAAMPRPYAHLMLRYAGNKTGVLELGFSSGKDSYRMLMLVGTRGAAYLNPPEVGVLLMGRCSRFVSSPSRHDRLQEWQAILQRIQKDEGQDKAFNELEDCLAAALAAAKSIERGEPISPDMLLRQGELA
jgi:predicted dehydrogenase